MLKDQLADEASKRGEAERDIAWLRGELEKHSVEVEAMKADSYLQKQAMEKGIGDAKIFQDNHDALQGGILKIAKVVLARRMGFLMLFSVFLGDFV